MIICHTNALSRTPCGKNDEPPAQISARAAFDYSKCKANNGSPVFETAKRQGVAVLLFNIPY